MSKNKQDQKHLPGLNYGSFDLNSPFLNCICQQSSIFRVPFEKIENCITVNKNELLLELDTKNANDEWIFLISLFLILIQGANLLWVPFLLSFKWCGKFQWEDIWENSFKRQNGRQNYNYFWTIEIFSSKVFE